MKKRIAVFCYDIYLFRKIFLILSPIHEVVRAPLSEASALRADLLLWNVSDEPLPEEPPVPLVTMGKGGELEIPFTKERLLEKIDGPQKNDTPILVLGEKCAYLRGEQLNFTEVEFALLCELVYAKGNFVSREDLIKNVWGSGVGSGVLNVYIHYLREKLEFNGEKIIVSSRKRGYKIDGKYVLRGGEEIA